MLQLSLKIFFHFNKHIDVAVICDESMIEACRDPLPKNVILFSGINSGSPVEASMHKVRIFDYDIMKYKAVLFCDTDILFQSSLKPILDNFKNDSILYTYTKMQDFRAHKMKYFSFNHYTEDDIALFREKNIKVFNAGTFGFAPSAIMKTHFENILKMIEDHTGEFYYEQPFMNVYFNKLGNTDPSILSSSSNLLLNRHDGRNAVPHKIIHFYGSPGVGERKIDAMRAYISRQMHFIK